MHLNWLIILTTPLVLLYYLYNHYSSAAVEIYCYVLLYRYFFPATYNAHNVRTLPNLPTVSVSGTHSAQRNSTDESPLNWVKRFLTPTLRFGFSLLAFDKFTVLINLFTPLDIIVFTQIKLSDLKSVFHWLI